MAKENGFQQVENRMQCCQCQNNHEKTRRFAENTLPSPHYIAKILYRHISTQDIKAISIAKEVYMEQLMKFEYLNIQLLSGGGQIQEAARQQINITKLFLDQ